MTHYARHSAPDNDETLAIPAIVDPPGCGQPAPVRGSRLRPVLLGSALLVAAAVALLWYVAFPALDPYLPINDSGTTSSQDGSPVQDSVVPPPTASPSPAPAPHATR